MSAITLFWDIGQEGESQTFFTDVSNLKDKKAGFNGWFENWNDETSSLRIHGGVWQFFLDIDYVNLLATLGPGDYRWVGDFGIPNDSLSSFRCIQTAAEAEAEARREGYLEAIGDVRTQIETKNQAHKNSDGAKNDLDDTLIYLDKLIAVKKKNPAFMKLGGGISGGGDN